MVHFNTGVTALQTSERALQVIGNNIANANTPGYHRQVARLTSTVPYQQAGLSIGTGVAIPDIGRLRSRVVEDAITRQMYATGDVDARLQGMQSVETQLTVGDSSAGDQLTSLFNQFEQLSSQLNNTTLRNQTVSTGKGLTDELNRLAGEFGQVAKDADGTIAITVQNINDLSKQIATLNEEIQRVESRGIDAHDLRDQRDQRINDLATLVNVNVTEEQNAGQSNVRVGGIPLVLGNRSIPLEVTSNPANPSQTVVVAKEMNVPVDATGGKLGGLLHFRNVALSDVQQRLDTFANQLIRAIDEVHATGMGTAGPLTQLTSRRTVSSATASLASAGLAYPPQAGSLFIGVTDLATGSRTLHEVAIAPTNSLQDVATAISGVPNVQAVVSASDNTLSISAAAGFGFDFAGGFDAPNTTGLTAATTTTPRMAGFPDRASNDTFTFTFTGTSGTIGETPGLMLQVTDQSGVVVATQNVGKGYVPGSALQVADGVSVALSSGTANVGDSFSTRMVSHSDTAGILTTLGLNTFFVGSDASSIGINPDLLGNTERLATSRSGDVGDSSNVLRLAALRDTPLLSGGKQTLQEFFTETVTTVGSQVQNLTNSQQTNQILGERLQAEQQSISGVDVNEELTRMLQFQRMFQMAAEQIKVVNATFDALFQILS